jgi:L-rhamnose isomerase
MMWAAVQSMYLPRKNVHISLSYCRSFFLRTHVVLLVDDRRTSTVGAPASNFLTVSAVQLDFFKDSIERHTASLIEIEILKNHENYFRSYELLFFQLKQDIIEYEQCNGLSDIALTVYSLI